MFGEVEKSKLITTTGGQAGDAILMTKGIVIEGAAIMAREKGDFLRQQGISEEL